LFVEQQLRDPAAARRAARMMGLSFIQTKQDPAAASVPRIKERR
jgi:hypothetical protein